VCVGGGVSMLREGGGQMAECSQPVVFVLLFMNMVHPSY
jgi:hypothetical protein